MNAEIRRLSSGHYAVLKGRLVVGSIDKVRRGGRLGQRGGRRMNDTYQTLRDASADLSRATEAYMEAAYQNYRQRLVSGEGALHHAEKDARIHSAAAIEDASYALQVKIVEGEV